ncbi:DUF559 domain-containing protein [Plantibacter sp. T3]|uniref:DUF559 domain-containing protein n=1 Tax=Plantibacter sp. T3 TaxID=2653161 RepID=UPI0012F42D9A|nr:DUF559 domain-containing protein [Plantibacter sp. T3]VXC43773.1 conserved hypothetical protein [Plantibacter sp. T3]
MTFRSSIPIMAGPKSAQSAVRAGFTPRQLRNPALGAPFHGIRTPPGYPTDLYHQAVAYLSVLPIGGAFSHQTAAALHGIPTPRSTSPDVPLHVMSPAGVRAREGRGVVGHRGTLGPGDVVDLDGLPVTSVERTWCDLATVVPLPALIAAGDALLWFLDPRTSLDRLRAAVEEYPSRRGVVALRSAIPRLHDRCQSPKETELRLILEASALPKAEHNAEIVLHGSGRVVRGDVVFRDQRLVLEYEGDHHRTDRSQWRKDIARTEELAHEGWTVMRLTADDLRRPSMLAERIRVRLGGPGRVEAVGR